MKFTNDIFEAGIALNNILKNANDEVFSLKAQVLFLVGKAGNIGATPTNIMLSVKIAKTNLAILCKSLEKERLIIKRRNEKDARNKFLTLTEDGKKWLISFEEKLNEGLNKKLSSEQISELCRCCEKIYALLKSERNLG